MQTLASLQSVRSAFGMGPKERAVYLRRPVPKGRQVVEQSGEEEAGTVAGTNAAALRAWLRQVGMPPALHAVLHVTPCNFPLEFKGYIHWNTLVS